MSGLNEEFYAFPSSSSDERTMSNPEWKEYLRVPEVSPSKQSLPAVIRVLSLPVYSRPRHTVRKDAKSKYLDCSARYPSVDFGGKCVGCYYSEKDSKVFSNIMDSFVFTVLDKRLYHSVESSEGEVSYEMCKKNIGTAILCHHCDKGNEPKIVGRRHWTIGKGYFRTLKQTNFELATKCTECDGTIVTTNLICPKCKSDLIPPEYLTKMLPIDGTISSFSTHKCIRCGETVLPKDIVQVVQCTNGCKTPSRGSIYKCDLEVTVLVDDKKKGGARELRISPRKFVPVSEEQKSTIKQYDFERIFKPMSLDRQASYIGVVNPFKEKEQHSVEYSAPPKLDDNSKKVVLKSDDDLDVFGG